MSITFFCTACEHNAYCACGCGGGKSIEVHSAWEARERYGWDQIDCRWVCYDCLRANRKPAPLTCPWCGCLNDNDPGDYYHRKMCEARYLRDCLLRETDPIEIARLRRRLTLARETGD